MKIVIKKINPRKYEGGGVEINPTHTRYFFVEDGVELTRRVKECICSTLSPIFPMLGILYQIAIDCANIVELGIGYGKSMEVMLMGLHHGKKNGHLYSVDGGNIHTQASVDKITKDQSLNEHFTWVKNDFFELPDKWLKNREADLTVCDFNPERIRPQEVYTEIYPDEPIYYNSKNPRNYTILMDKMLTMLRIGGLIVMRWYTGDFSIVDGLEKSGKVKVVYKYISPNQHGIPHTYVIRKLK